MRSRPGPGSGRRGAAACRTTPSLLPDACHGRFLPLPSRWSHVFLSLLPCLRRSFCSWIPASPPADLLRAQLLAGHVVHRAHPPRLARPGPVGQVLPDLAGGLLVSFPPRLERVRLSPRLARPRPRAVLVSPCPSLSPSSVNPRPSPRADPPFPLITLHPSSPPPLVTHSWFLLTGRLAIQLGLRKWENTEVGKAALDRAWTKQFRSWPSETDMFGYHLSNSSYAKACDELRGNCVFSLLPAYAVLPGGGLALGGECERRCDARGRAGGGRS